MSRGSLTSLELEDRVHRERTYRETDCVLLSTKKIQQLKNSEESLIHGRFVLNTFYSTSSMGINLADLCNNSELFLSVLVLAE